MCKPYQRCANHAKQKLAAAQKSGDTKRIAAAQREYEFTPEYAKRLRAEGNVKKAEFLENLLARAKAEYITKQVRVMKSPNTPYTKTTATAWDKDEPREVRKAACEGLMAHHPIFSQWDSLTELMKLADVRVYRTDVEA